MTNEIAKLFSLEGKAAVITGASRGIGEEIARVFALAGARVVMNSRKEKGIREAADKIKANGGEALPVVGNVSSSEDRKKLINASMEWAGRIDILVNNAGYHQRGLAEEIGVADLGKMVDVNLKAPMLISKAIFRKMIQAKSGQIINILSMSPKLCVVGDSVYAATKSGLEAFSRVLNKEGHPFGVHVNNIGLSAFPSGMLEQIIGSDPEKVLNLIPHKQFAPLKEIIAAIEFFETNSNDIGGQTLFFGGV